MAPVEPCVIFAPASLWPLYEQICRNPEGVLGLGLAALAVCIAAPALWNWFTRGGQ